MELGIEQLSMMGMHPVQFIELAAKLGAPNISLGLKQMDFDPFGFPRFSLASDAALRREVKAALAANGVRLALGENLAILPRTVPETLDGWKMVLDLLGELGAAQYNSVSFEPDYQRNVEKYAALAELAAGYDARVLLEFVPSFGVRNLAEATGIIEEVGAPNLGLIFDTMHAARTGLEPQEAARIAPHLIGHIQLCDVPAGAQSYPFMDEGYMDEASFQRLCPGDGVLPLAEYLRALPKDRVVALEVPLRDAALAGVPLQESMARCVSATRALIDGL